MFCSVHVKEKNMAYATDKSGFGPLQKEEYELGAHCLDLFSRPVVEKSLLHGKTIQHNTVNAIDSDGPFEFVIQAHAHNEYSYLPYTRLEGSVRVVNKDGTKITKATTGQNAVAATDVSICNLFPSALFSQVECKVNNVQIADLSTPTYPYKAYLETLLSYGKRAKKGHLQACYWYDDDEGDESETSLAGTHPTTLNRRQKHIEGSKLLHFSTPLHIDLFQSNRLLPPGCSVSLKFIRSTDNFALIGKAGGEFKIQFEDLKLYSRKIIVHDNIIAKHNSLFNNFNANYPIAVSQIKTYVLTSGINSQTISNIFRGKLPRQLIFGLLTNKSYNGILDANPFNFDNHKLKYVALKKNGSLLPSNAFQPDFSSGDIMREFRHFYDNVGIAHEDNGLDINVNQWKSGKNLWVYDLSSDLCNGYHTHQEETGYIDLDLTFETQLSETLYLLVYGVFDTVLGINKDRYPVPPE